MNAYNKTQLDAGNSERLIQKNQRNDLLSIKIVFTKLVDRPDKFVKHNVSIVILSAAKNLLFAYVMHDVKFNRRKQQILRCTQNDRHTAYKYRLDGLLIAYFLAVPSCQASGFESAEKIIN
ncbi:MAG: hypothetical protein V4568_10525 [Pseudomonadota bacterium]